MPTLLSYVFPFFNATYSLPLYPLLVIACNNKYHCPQKFYYPQFHSPPLFSKLLYYICRKYVHSHPPKQNYIFLTKFKFLTFFVQLFCSSHARKSKKKSNKKKGNGKKRSDVRCWTVHVPTYLTTRTILITLIT